MEVILLNEPNKLKWKILFLEYINNELITICEGTFYNAIPHKDEIIIMNNDVYIIESVTYDYDEANIYVIVKKKEK